MTSERLAGKSLANSWLLAPDITLQKSAAVDLNQVDCVFSCLPHTRSAPIADAAEKAEVSVIDLSADLRLNTAKEFEYWYKVAHPAPNLLPAVYGLPEHYREQIKKSSMIANPGCYATTMLFQLIDRYAVPAGMHHSQVISFQGQWEAKHKADEINFLLISYSIRWVFSFRVRVHKPAVAIFVLVAY